MRTAAMVGLVFIGIGVGLGAGYALREGADAPPREGPVRSHADPSPTVHQEDVAAPRAAPGPGEDLARAGPAPRGAPAAGRPAAALPPGEPPPCPVCSPAAACGGPRDELVQALREDNTRLRAKVADARERLRKTGPQRRYLEPSVQGRRRLAAEEDSLLLEIPSWKDDIALRDEVEERLALEPGERDELEALVREFRRTLHRDLQALLSEMTGDPGAGENATIDSMIHDIIQLSPADPCREQMQAITTALVTGAPLPRAAGDGPVCETLILALFAAVDGLDAEIRGTLGEDAAGVIWRNTSTFEYGPLGGDGGGALVP
ncbi:MAG: hypothetical protein ABIK09_12545 [Pseudomonadota bacterium]